MGEAVSRRAGTLGSSAGHCPGESRQTIAVGCATDLLGELSADRFRACVTSPPYWGLRDYGIDGQIGGEASLEAYIDSLVTTFREVRRVLTEDGTLWLNLGDGYTSGGRAWRDADKKNAGRAMSYRPATPDGLKPKDLIGVPWRVAFALQGDGWYLRTDIVWHKPNCQPESVKDRPTRAHEFIFMFSRSERYYYDHEAVREASASGCSRNRRTVWSVNTEAYPEAHFATYPRQLIEPCILAGSEPGDEVLDPFLGSGTTGVVAAALGRSCYGIEINPEYARLARCRILGG